MNDGDASSAGTPAAAGANDGVGSGGGDAAPVSIGIASGLQFRMDERYEVEGDAEVLVTKGEIGTTVLRGRILDISSSGCYIQTIARVPIRPGTEVQIVFSIYGTTFRLGAVSRYARAKVGIGFRFFEMPDTMRQRLYAVLADIRSKLIREAPKGELPVVERMRLDA